MFENIFLLIITQGIYEFNIIIYKTFLKNLNCSKGPMDENLDQMQLLSKEMLFLQCQNS